MYKYKIIACGGTFDLMHRGHQEFLKFALSAGKHVLVGLTTSRYNKKYKNNAQVEPYAVRKKSLRAYLKSIGAEKRTKIIPIDDPFGPLVKKISIDALVVSENTLDGASIINKARKEKKLPPLATVIFSLTKAEDGRPISSGIIRTGEIDRNGRLYVKPQWLKQTLYLPDSLRITLKKPLGRLIKVNHSRSVASFPLREWDGIADELKTVTVGDVVTKFFNEASFGQWLSVIDFKVARENMFSEISELGFLGNEKIIKVNNPRGLITGELTSAINNLFRSADFSSRVIIKVDGEEDMAVLPILLAAPLGFTVFYGQPEKGVVRVEVSEKNKEKTYNIVAKFSS